jgi:very-short-patch-repair endonuclease
MRSSTLTLKRAKSLRRAMTKPEVLLWTRLRRGAGDLPPVRRQQPMGPYILDFFCSAARLAIEIDGAGHGEDEQRAHDERRDLWLAEQGIDVYRIPARSVLQNPEAAADGVKLKLMARLRSE